MANQTIDIEASVADFPAGVKMTPAQFFQWFVENVTFRGTGAFLTGQIGGTRPTTNVGPFIKGRVLELWDGAAYGSVLTPPIGAMFPWPSKLIVAPDDYLFCDGQLVLKTDYPLLRDVILDAWKATGDDPAYFRLPNTQGRVVEGAGTGDNNPLKASGVPTGSLSPRAVGDYFGSEWPTYRQTTPPNAPAGRYYYVPYRIGVYDGPIYTGVTQPSLACRWLIRAK